MEIHQLRYFLCHRETRNIHPRSGDEYVAQPSLSQQIHKLEDELGGKLFYRLPRQRALPFWVSPSCLVR